MKILLRNGHQSILVTTIPDSDEFEGQHSFDHILEWFMCSTNPYFKHHYKNGLRIVVRDKVATIDLMKITKERKMK